MLALCRAAWRRRSGHLLFPGGIGVVILLTADGLHLHQLGVTLGLEASAALVGLGLARFALALATAA